LQAKLTIGASNDPLEQEADRVADQVLATPANAAVSSSPPHIQRFTGQTTGAADTAPASVDRVLASPGRPMEPELRQDMEKRFGHDFSRVRVHSGSAAEKSALEVNANAYTVGSNIVFGSGQLAPGTRKGRQLIAHELTHVVQQSGLDSNHVGQNSEKGGEPGLIPNIPIRHNGLEVLVRQAATVSADPTMTSGSLTISEKKLTIEQQGGEALANSMGFKIAKPFSVSASAQILEPSTHDLKAEPFEYGLVQNLFFDHIEEVFSDGDMLVDSVGPMVDIDPSNLSELPFIHGNATMPQALFTTLRVGQSFTDIPSLEVKLNMEHCKKNVQLKSVIRSVHFRVGLVARGLRTKRLVSLGATPSTYGLAWQVDFTGPSFKFTESANLSGSPTLSASAPPVVTDGKVAGVEGQKTLSDETIRFKQRCENVL